MWQSSSRDCARKTRDVKDDQTQVFDVQLYLSPVSNTERKQREKGGTLRERGGGWEKGEGGGGWQRVEGVGGERE